MNVYLTFDVEIWCGGWQDLDQRFPSSFQRYVYGGSVQGGYALPKTLEILDKHKLHGVFFVEPLFAGRFGVEHLATVVSLIQQAGQEVQLHLHPEWADEIRPLPFPGAVKKRQHLSYYSLDEQVALISLGKRLLAEAGCSEVQTFRAGSFAANADTYRALESCHIGIDSSLNRCQPESAPDLRESNYFDYPSQIGNVVQIPITVFEDGFGQLRPAQIGACGFTEMREAIESAASRGDKHFMMLSHNFEMLRPGRTDPDPIVVRRFESLCAYLDDNRNSYQTTGLSSRADITLDSTVSGRPKVSSLATGRRLVEQGIRRIVG